MRAVAVLVGLVGCGFNAATSVDASMTGSDSAIAGSDGGMLAGSDGGKHDAPPNPLCSATDPTGLVLCLELDDANLTTTAKDGSGLGHDAAVSGLAGTVTRDVPIDSQAATIDLGTTIVTADSTDFDLQKLTLMAWVDRTDTPSGDNTYGLVYNFDQYWMGIDNNGDLECVLEFDNDTIEIYTGANIPMNSWTLTGCTYDGTQVCGTVQTGPTGSKQTTCQGVSGTLSSAGQLGILIGSRWDSVDQTVYQHLIGSIDSARIFDRALTDTEICTEGGRSGC
jgi:hypothetical protein